MRITVVRHGQTTGNINRIVESRAGGTLTEKGVLQAQLVADKLKDKHFDAVFCSSKQRCADTASHILKFHPENMLFLRDDIWEMDKGIYDGGSWDDLPDYIGADTYINTRLEGGESWQDVKNRVSRFLDEIFESGYSEVLVVTHDGILKVFHSLLEGMELADAIKIYHDNATVYTWQMTHQLAREDVE